MGQQENPAQSVDDPSRLDQRRDDSLIPYLQKGVRAAVSELERRYGDALRRRAGRLLNDPSLAEDMVQELMLQCCRGEEGKLPERQLRAWLYRSLRNRCTDELRKRRVRTARRIDEPTPSHAGEVPIDPLTSPGSKVAKFEQLNALMHLIDGFEPKLREVLVLRYFENRSRSEIGEELGISESVVKARLVKAVAKLREKLSEVRKGSGV
jgi:RNA polymerase sigma-70 factor (ECF subfamily)